MKHTWIVGAVLCLVGGLAWAIADEPAAKGEKKMGDKPTEIKHPSGKSSEELMQEYMQYVNPCDGHKIFEKWPGKWKLTMKAWMDPSKPPMVSEHAMESKHILGGRFVMVNISGKMMGMQNDMIEMFGYDCYKKQYDMVLFSSCGTAVYHYTGQYDAATKTLDLRGTMDDNIGKRPVRTTFKIVSDDEHEYETFDTLPNGKEFRVMAGTVTRVK